MEENIQRKKISLILEVIIFLGIVFIGILLFYSLNDKYNLTQKLNDNLYLSNESTVEEENKLYIKNLKKNYGINVEYGEKTLTLVKNNSAIIQCNENIVNNNLKIITQALEKYPIDIFDMSKSKKYPINIILVNNFTNNNLALASRSSLNEFRIYISNTQNFERAFHHEMYHILEYYMSDTHKYLYASWNTLNPEDFEYEKDISKLNNKYVYNENMQNSLQKQNDTENILENENPYFVTKYSKTTQKEDRAEIFAELMVATKKYKYLTEGQNIKKKVDLIVSTVKKNITINNFYFYKFID